MAVEVQTTGGLEQRIHTEEEEGICFNFKPEELARVDAYLKDYMEQLFGHGKA